MERWNPFAKVTQDLFGFIDIVCLTGYDIVGVQCTSAKNHASRRVKILDSPLAREWVRSGGRILVISWKKQGRLWVEREEEISTDKLT